MNPKAAAGHPVSPRRLLALGSEILPFPEVMHHLAIMQNEQNEISVPIHCLAFLLRVLRKPCISALYTNIYHMDMKKYFSCK